MSSAKKKVFAYEGEEATVTWDERLCIHSSECNRAGNELFVGGREPWCQPDLVRPAEVEEVVSRCPSGALSSVRRDGTNPEIARPSNELLVSANGPYYVSGDLKIEGAPEDMPGVRFRAALCRCGQSETKPFCDNSHKEADFRDSGAVGETGEPLEEEGGPLTVQPMVDGPLLVRGNLTIRACSGRPAWRGTKTALCRCGHSNNKPFCDGSHRRVGFKSE